MEKQAGTDDLGLDFVRFRCSVKPTLALLMVGPPTSGW